MNVLLIYCVMVMDNKYLVLIRYISIFAFIRGLILGLCFTVINNLYNPANKDFNKSRKYGIIV